MVNILVVQGTPVIGLFTILLGKLNDGTHLDCWRLRWFFLHIGNYEIILAIFLGICSCLLVLRVYAAPDMALRIALLILGRFPARADPSNDRFEACTGVSGNYHGVLEIIKPLTFFKILLSSHHILCLGRRGDSYAPSRRGIIPVLFQDTDGE